MDIKSVIQALSGKSCVEEYYDNRKFVNDWREWYGGKVKNFHSYSVWNGVKQVRLERFSLNMPKRVAEDWANLLINEKTFITLDDEASQAVLDSVLEQCDFWHKANDGIEKTFALGSGALVVSVDGLQVKQSGEIIPDGKINVTFVNALKIRPITIEDGKIVECAFFAKSGDNTNVSIHIRDELNNYKIINAVCKGTNDDSLTVNPDSVYTFETKSPLPWFVIIKPNIGNNIDINSPLGISIYANALDVIRGIDIAYDSFVNEFILGKKRVFVSAKALRYDETGAVPVFDTNDTVYYQLPEAEDGKPLIADVTQALRVAEHQTGIQTLLNLLSYVCGLGSEHYKFEQGGVATATQIVSENSEMFRNVRKHEIIIEQELIRLTKTLIYAINTFTGQRVNENSNVTIKFDDSIIEDKTTELMNDRYNVNLGVMSKAEFRAKWFGEDIDTATKKVEEMSTTVLENPYINELG